MSETVEATEPTIMDLSTAPQVCYNYKCPNCDGEFNTPGCVYGTGTDVYYKCPFCGRTMEGLN